MGGLKYGEIVLGIRPSGIRNLLKLAENKVYRNTVAHKEIVDKQSALVKIGRFVFRRPTLSEYTNLMKRTATPNYPKDMWAILGLLDVGQDSVVLEAGSGSGSLTLHLSRAVGATGQVFSFESNLRHIESAKNNFDLWRHNWALTRGTEWPDNVTFVSEDVRTLEEHVTTATVDCVALDVADPGPLLTYLMPKLQTSSSISVYLANLTQFVDLMKHVKEDQLELNLERVIEVGQTEWAVREVSSKASRLGSVAYADKYICRPEHQQQPHTGFIGLLRCTKGLSFLPQDSTRADLAASSPDNNRENTDSCLDPDLHEGGDAPPQDCDSQNTETLTTLENSDHDSCRCPNSEAEVVRESDNTSNEMDTSPMCSEPGGDRATMDHR